MSDSVVWVRRDGRLARFQELSDSELSRAYRELLTRPQDDPIVLAMLDQIMAEMGVRH